MKTIKVKAVFKGQDGSCEYNTNKEYTLIIHKNSDKKNPHFDFYIENENGGGYCEYESIVSFLNNWDCVRHV